MLEQNVNEDQYDYLRTSEPQKWYYGQASLKL